MLLVVLPLQPASPAPVAPSAVILATNPFTARADALRFALAAILLPSVCFFNVVLASPLPFGVQV
jgi:hypothetical protein